MSGFLACPMCKVALISKDQSLCCENCGLEYVIDDSIYDFIGSNGSYWGEISLENMEEALKVAKLVGWRTAARNVGLRHPSLNEYLLSDARIDWLFHCIDFSKIESCLDIGSGWGSITFGLARYYDEVWSLEAVKQRIEFQKLRREQDNVDNVKFVRADWLRLPFSDNHFDLVVANGVLEWLGLSDHSRNPREVQIDFLKEVKRVLKPGGCLYIGIENRFGLPLFLGGKDHSGLRFTSILPRKFADIVVKLSGKGGEYRQGNQIKKWQDYRTYTYSYWGYRHILKEAGFNQVKRYWTLSYNNPKYSGRFDGESFTFLLKSFRQNTDIARTPRSFISFIGTYLPNWAIRLVLPLICSDFLIYSYKGEMGENFESKLLSLGLPNSSFLKLSGTHGRTSKVSYFLLRDSKPCCVLKFPRFNAGSVRIEIEETKMGRFNSLDIKRETVDTIPVFIEPFIKGIQPDAYKLLYNREALTWLLDFQLKTRSGYWELPQLEEKINKLVRFLSDVPIDEGVRSRTKEDMELFLQSLHRVKLAKNSEHGDFCMSNMLISNNEQLYVTDWEFYTDEGDPLFDFTFFLLVNLKKGSMPKSLKDNFLGRGKYSEILHVLISEFAKSKQMPEELVLQAISYTIVRCIYRAAAGPDNNHLDMEHYLELLKIWDGIYHYSENRVANNR